MKRRLKNDSSAYKCYIVFTVGLLLGFGNNGLLSKLGPFIKRLAEA